ncbi:MAG: trypsin-like peptidase domain-containing protein [Pseudomonadota bacterium]
MLATKITPRAGGARRRTGHSAAWLVLGAILLASPTARADYQQPGSYGVPDEVSKAAASTIWFKTGTGDKAFGHCSGAVVGRQEILTAFHCIRRFAGLPAFNDFAPYRLSEEELDGLKTKSLDITFLAADGRLVFDGAQDGNSVKIERLDPTLVAFAAQTHVRDWALLSVSSDLSLPPVPVRRKPARRDETVYALGYPGSAAKRHPVVSPGTVRGIEADRLHSLRTLDPPVIPPGAKTAFRPLADNIRLATYKAERGVSGGPVVDDKGQLLGVHTGGLVSDRLGEVHKYFFSAHRLPPDLF